MLKPPALLPSSVVGVVAPASPVRPEFLEMGLAELARMGLRGRLGRSLYSRSRYTAGDASSRAEDLMTMWEDPDVGAVFCALGGYGSLELVERLDPARLRANPKILVGSSDVTALLCLLLSRAGLVCLHGPMVAQHMARGEGAYDRPGLLAMLSSPKPGGRIDGPATRLLHPGVAEGTLVGGCLSIVAALVGTPYLPRFDGAVVFLEDRAVKPYQIDRMLTQLRLSGALEGVRGLVFGEMPDCMQHPEQGYTLEELLTDLTAGLRVPVMYGLPSGHTVSPAKTLPLGIRARLDTTGLHLLEGAVV